MKIFKLISFLFFALALHAVKAIEIIKSPSDYRNYSYLELENGFKVIVVSDLKAKANYCSLTVGTGSFSDPEDLPGLAHLLEHSVFLGTEKFPSPDLLKHAILENSGYFNARTNSETTDYFYVVDPIVIERTVSLLSSSISSPLFNEKYIEREKHVVNEEYRMNLDSDSYKVVDVYKEISNPQHPYHRFNVGNLESFPKDNHYLHLKLKDFFEKNYCPNKMTLSLIGPQSTEYLLGIAKKYFSEIPQRQCKINRLPSIFNKHDKNLDIAIKSRKESAPRLALMYVLPKNNTAYYEKGALNFLMHLIKSKSKNSLYSLLRDKKYITDLEVNIESFSTEEIFSIFFDLTPLGYTKRDEVSSIFSYFIGLLKKQGYPEDFYHDLVAMRALRWKYNKFDSSLNFAINLSSNLQKYSPEKAVIGNVLLNAPEYEKNLPFINQTLNQFKNKNLRRVVMSSDIKGDKHTHWFNAEYKIKSTLNNLKINTISTSSLKKDNLFPTKNEYIPKDILINDEGNKESIKFPKKILENSGVDLWYFHDEGNHGPFSSLYFNLATKEVNKTARSVALADIVTKSFNNELENEIYDALLWGGSFSIYQNPRGISFKLHGFSSTQAKIAQKVYTFINTSPISVDKFLIAKQSVIQNYRNKSNLSLFDQTRTSVTKLVKKPQYDESDLLKEISNLTYEEFINFIQAIRKDWHIEVLVNGNYTISQAMEISDIFKCKNTTKPPSSIFKMAKLPLNTIYYKNLNYEENSHSISLYIQNIDSQKSSIETIIINNLLEKEFHSQIRTEQKLGYAVTTDCLTNGSVGGIIFSIQSSYEPSFLYKRIMRFLKDQHKAITLLSEKELDQIKLSLISNFKSQPQSLQEQSDSFFSQIESGNFDFNYENEMIKTIKQVHRKDIVKRYESLISTKNGQLIVATQSPLEKKKLYEVAGWEL